MNDRYGHLHLLHRLYQVCGTIGALVLALVLGTVTGRSTLVRLYLEPDEAITNAAHIHAFSMDRLDPTCPQCM